MRHPLSDTLPRNHPTRRGVVVVIAMIGILVASSLSVVLLRCTLTERELAEREERRQQTIWLTEAGISRARALYGQDPAFSVAVWKLTDAELGSGRAAEVTMQVEAGGSPKMVTVTAVYLPGTLNEQLYRKSVPLVTQVVSVTSSHRTKQQVDLTKDPGEIP